MITVDDALNALKITAYLGISVLIIVAVAWCVMKFIQWIRDDFRF